MRKIPFIFGLLAVISLFNFQDAFSQDRALSRDTALCIRSASCQKLFFATHRANGFGAPENSREAVKKAIDAGIPVIEIDLSVSQDGIIYIFHDEGLEGKTTGKGRIQRKNSQELNNVFLANGETPPRFEEIYALSRGKAVLDLHFKADVMEEVAQFIFEKGSFDDAIFFASGGRQLKTAAKLKKRYPDMIVMARIFGRGEISEIKKIFKPYPELIHISGHDAKDIERIRKLGFKVFVKALEKEDLSRIQDFISHDSGNPDIILTDDPKEWLKRLSDIQK